MSAIFYSNNNCIINSIFSIFYLNLQNKLFRVAIMTARDKVKDKTATIRYNEDLMQKYNLLKETIERKEIKSFSDGQMWIYCLNFALDQPVNVAFLRRDKKLDNRKQVRVNNITINNLSKLKKLINKYKEVKSESEVWRYCLKVTYDAIVGSDYNGKE